MAQQVITIETDGTISGLQVKPGKGLDLQKLGKEAGTPAKTVRASEIAWNEMEQVWFIDVLQSAGKGVVTFPKLKAALSTVDMMTTSELDYQVGKGAWTVKNEVLYFSSYDDAVKIEILYLDALRQKGIF